MVETRLIFHLSYDFPNGNKSVNYHIPDEKCTVKYRDLDHAITHCLRILKNNPHGILWFGISDLKSAFRVVPLKKKYWFLLTMRVKNPTDGKWYFFIDKCLSFGVAISCAIFQKFSNALAHITAYKLKIYNNIGITNYLDDYLKIALSEQMCNLMIKTFQKICNLIGVSLATEKTVWAATQVVFLGILLDGIRRLLGIPEAKRCKAIEMLVKVSEKKRLR